MERSRVNVWTGKGIAAYTWDALCITPNICQAGAAGEGPAADAGHAVRDGDGGQAGATRESTAADAGHAVGDNSVLATCYQSVCLCFNNCITVVAWIILSVSCFYFNGGQAAALIEGIVSDAGHAVWDGDGGQARAVREGRAADAGHAVWDGDGGQACAVREGRVADAGHAVWDGDGGQAAATIEGIVFDAGHAVPDSDRGQAAAIRVFANAFISAICT